MLVKRIFIGGAIAFLLGLTHLAHLDATAAGVAVGLEEGGPPRLFVPDARMIRWLAFGQHTAASDVYWLQLIQYVGTPEADRAGWPQLLDIGNLVVDLDPEHGYAYETIGVLLNSKRRIDESNLMLEKGIENVPDRWQLPFFAAFNYYFELEDPVRGATLLQRAAKLPGSPAYVPLLVARLYNTAGQIETALAFVETAMRESGGQEPAYSSLEERRNELLIERDLLLLEKSMERYQERTGRRPSSLDDLVGSVLVAIPVSPTGRPYSYDPGTGTVSSPELPDRVRYRKFGSEPEATNDPGKQP